MVNTTSDEHAFQEALYNHINRAVFAFNRWYEHELPYPIEIHPTDAIATLQNLCAEIQVLPHKLYLLIDEYDNFANAVLMQQNPESHSRYEALVSGEGLLKTLFKAVKAALEEHGLDRVFMTGVSPMVVNDMTSGFNMVKDLSLHPKLTHLCGFLEPEVTALMRDIAESSNFTDAHVSDAMETMKIFYHGYSFQPTEPPQLYNPTLTLYFLDYLQDISTYPPNLLDKNLAMDQAKIAYIVSKPHGKAVVARAVNDHTPP